MKTDIYTLLGMIKDNKAPKLILFKDRQWNYDEKEKDYLHIDFTNEYLFDSYVITDILNDEVEIIETIVYTAEISKSKENEMYIIERVDENGNIIMSKSEYKPTITYKPDKIERLEIKNIYDCNDYQNIFINFRNTWFKINEIIDYINSTK